MRPGKILCAALLAVLLAAPARASDSPAEDGDTYLVPIVMYHEVKPFKAGKDVILPWEFEADLRYLTENGYATVVMADLIAWVRDGVPLPEKPVVLSFDDGYLNNYVYVFPLLRQYGVRIVFSIIGKNTDDFTEIPDDNVDYSHVTWEQLREMLDSGLVEVQNHTYDLHGCRSRLGCLPMPHESDAAYERILTEDVLKLQDEIRLMTGRTPTTFAYPYGKKGRATDDILKKLGFSATLSCDYGVNTVSRDPECLYGLRRICRSHGQDVGTMLDEAMKTVKTR